MRYISRIVGYPDGHVVFDWKTELFVRVNSDGVEHEMLATALIGSNVLGYTSVAMYPSCPGLVCYNSKTVQLFRYVKSAKTQEGVSVVDLRNSDSCELGAGFAGSGDSRLLVVNTGYDCIRVCGHMGSVVVVEENVGTSLSICTLYDLLIWLCKRMKANIMTYERIQLYRQWNYSTVIELEHSQEADRFFMKMYLDGIRQ